MSFGSFVHKISDAINDSVRAIANSGVIPNAVGKTTRLGMNIGKTAGNLGFKVGVTGIAKGADALSFFIDNKDTIKKGATKFGKAMGKEAGEWANAGLGMLGKFEDTFLEPADFGRSIIGRKFNKKGLALIAAGSVAMQGGRDMKQYIDQRQGSNDGRLYGTTPTMSTPYQLSEQMAYSQHGRSFADNASATGDLVFALNNMRNG